MRLSEFKEFVGQLADSKDLKVTTVLRDKLFRNGLGMPLSRARKVASLVTVGSTDEDFLDELAGLLYDLSVIIVSKLGEEAFFSALSEMPVIYKD